MFFDQLVEGSWGRQERRMEVDRVTKEEVSKKRTREEEKEEFPFFRCCCHERSFVVGL